MNAVGGDARKPEGWRGGVASSAGLKTAFDWMCKRRFDYGDNTDVWNTGPGSEVSASAGDCRDRRTGYLHDLDSGGSAGFVSDL